MKKIVLIIGAICLWTSLFTSCYFATKLLEIKRKCTTQYDYIDTNGKKGTTQHCYETEDGLICKAKNKSFRVNRFEKLKSCS